MQNPVHVAVSPDTRIKLVNARFTDVANGKYFPSGTSLILQNGKIMAMPGIQGQPDGYPGRYRDRPAGKDSHSGPVQYALPFTVPGKGANIAKGRLPRTSATAWNGA